ncbi:unnamed protein product [Dovyalis caffra]|uniref:Uncharacterized protein n=1 Tax=Dovyalis caffra TaxID=77055 RepID=A0AAV1S971_9ROSI|nr:unnamed protein product [Dovyalis caffra]
MRILNDSHQDTPQDEEKDENSQREPIGTCLPREHSTSHEQPANMSLVACEDDKRVPNAPFTCLTHAYLYGLSAELCTSAFLDGYLHANTDDKETERGSAYDFTSSSM